jgi:hypothetical protein
MQKSQIAMLKIKLMNTDAQAHVEQEEETGIRESIAGRHESNVRISDYE